MMVRLGIGLFAVGVAAFAIWSLAVAGALVASAGQTVDSKTTQVGSAKFTIQACAGYEAHGVHFGQVAVGGKIAPGWYGLSIDCPRY